MLLLIVSIFLGLLSILNKVFLYLGRKSGWISGMVIGLLSGFYFWAIDLRILGIAELGFFIVMLYGYIRRTDPLKEKSFHINIIMSILTLIMCYFLFVGSLTIIQTLSSLAFIWGGFLLSTPYKVLGWASFIIAHALTSFASFHELQLIFAYLQIISALICAYAFIKIVIQKNTPKIDTI